MKKIVFAEREINIIPLKVLYIYIIYIYLGGRNLLNFSPLLHYVILLSSLHRVYVS